MDNQVSWAGLLYGIGGGAFAVAGNYIASRLLKGADFRHQEETARAAAQISDASDIRRSYQAIIDSLQARIKTDEDDRAALWKLFNEMRTALEQCESKCRDGVAMFTQLQQDYEEKKREDRHKIANLEQEKEGLAERVRALELRLPERR